MKKETYIEKLRKNESRKQFIRSKYWMDWSKSEELKEKQTDLNAYKKYENFEKYTLLVQAEANKYNLSSLQLFILKVINGTRNIFVDDLTTLLKPVCSFETLRKNLSKLESLNLVHKKQYLMGTVYALNRGGNKIFNDSENRTQFTKTEISEFNVYQNKVIYSLVADKVIEEYVKSFADKYNNKDSNYKNSYILEQFVKNSVLYDFLDAISGQKKLGKFIKKYKVINYDESGLIELSEDQRTDFINSIDGDKSKIKEELIEALQSYKELPALIKEYQIDDKGLEVLAIKNNVNGISNYLIEHLISQTFLKQLFAKVKESNFMKFTNLSTVKPVESMEFLSDFIDRQISAGVKNLKELDEDISDIDLKISKVSDILDSMENNFLRYKDNKVSDGIKRTLVKLNNSDANINLGHLKSESDYRLYKNRYHSFNSVKSNLIQRSNSKNYNQEITNKKLQEIDEEITTLEGKVDALRSSNEISVTRYTANDDGVYETENVVTSFDYLRSRGIYIEGINGTYVEVAIIDNVANGLLPELMYKRMEVAIETIRGFSDHLQVEFTFYLHDERVYHSKSFWKDTVKSLDTKLTERKMGIYRDRVQFKLINKYYKEKKAFWLNFSKGGNDEK